MLRQAALLLAVLFAGCAVLPQSTPATPAAAAPQAPRVVMCPKANIIKAQNVMGMLPRVALGQDKLQVMALIGSPDHAETFALTDGHAVEVFFYHTPQTVCRVDVLDGRLLPIVFQNGKVLGYGQSYYRDFLVPVLRNPLSNMPEDQKFGTQAVPSAHAEVPVKSAPMLKADGTPSGRIIQEDMPTPRATKQARGDETGGEVEYDSSTILKRRNNINQVGAGEPLR